MRVQRTTRAAGAVMLMALGACAGSGEGASTAPSPTATGVASSDPAPTVSASPTTSPAPSSTPAPLELPRGGRQLLPRYRLVGYVGGAGSPAFGRLGVGSLDARVRELTQRATALAAGRQVMPVLELVTVVANDTPGPRGTYSTQISDDVVRRYLAAARRGRALLLLNIQPGREDFLSVVKRLRPWLEQPDVGLALDPEWAVGPGEVPGRTFGRTTGAELDAVAAYLDAVVRSRNLPQKALVFHQLAARVVVGQEAIQQRPGVAVIKSVDGIGTRAMKTDTWRVLTDDLPPSVSAGFKLFFDEDTRRGPLMTPRQVLALRPQPVYVLYE